jgi:hypothetical protein
MPRTAQSILANVATSLVDRLPDTPVASCVNREGRPEIALPGFRIEVEERDAGPFLKHLIRLHVTEPGVAPEVLLSVFGACIEQASVVELRQPETPVFTYEHGGEFPHVRST